jgi:HlyD family secretion protein
MRSPVIGLALVLGLLAACAPAPNATWQGYAEGEFVALAAPSAGYLATLDAPRGTKVSAGTRVFTLSTDPDRQAADSADARVAAATSRVENLASPHRQSEIAVLEANVSAAGANRELADADYARTAALAEQHLIALQALDNARTHRDAAAASLLAARESLTTAREALGRHAEVQAARSDLAAAQADAAQKHWSVERKQVTAPAEGEIADTYYRPGEWVPMGAPVASVLPDGQRRIRFFIPQADVSRIQMGHRVLARCDGCSRLIQGTVDYIAPQAEYTPPVIYSRETRARLVFRIEAAPTPADARLLHPGVPLDVSLAP